MKMRLHHAMAVLFVLLAYSCTKEGNTDISIPEAQNVVAFEKELLNIVNAHRADQGTPALEFSAVAYEYANTHTDYMINKGSLSHDNFSSRASSLTSATNAEAVAENVAKDYATASAAFEGWLNSSSHRNTLEGNFTHTAISVKKDSQGNYYYTQLFYR